MLCGCFPLAIDFTFGRVYMSMPLSYFIPAYPSPSLCPQVHSLHLHLYSCPAPRFFRTIFFFLECVFFLIDKRHFKVATSFYISISNYEDSHFSMSGPPLIIVCLFYYHHSSGCVVLICIFLMTNDMIKSIFTCAY